MLEAARPLSRRSGGVRSSPHPSPGTGGPSLPLAQGRPLPGQKPTLLSLVDGAVVLDLVLEPGRPGLGPGLACHYQLRQVSSP